ncbi:gamma carbonic anhydrase family protein [Sphingomonas solaris]|uniref:Gamma carbonic anhydrase family protein n=1 Tax=Alterirhizorhabdus solaris TaxID=2529389 RepID=A0A558RCN6_9SPHN|nr:gamma carbonic anhydrase family protein [Sphingomonas solaris]TVV77103.1 gamma carbonic anhydrase family protein [Sphingomonas solaris]
MGSAYIDPTARYFGDVRLGADSSLWPHAVIRAERNHVAIGACTSVQDHVVIHIGWDAPTLVGDYCTLGHRAVVHGCTIEAACLIGIGATVMDGAHIGRGSLVAAHSYVPPGMIVPPGSLVMGTPARVVRTVDLVRRHVIDTLLYRDNARAYARGDHRCWETIDLGALGDEADRIITAGV